MNKKSKHLYGSSQVIRTNLFSNKHFFSCECPDGKFGVTCQEGSSACTTGQNACAEGSKCSVVRDGSYRCMCPLGKTGEYCKEGK